MTTIRVMTWNIHAGIGPDRRCDLNRVVDLIRSHAPDVVALQEVDSRLKTSGLEPAFEFLAEALGPHSAQARLIADPNGDYGHVVLSRWPLANVATHDISVHGREPRAVIEVSLAKPGARLHIMAAHLGLGLRERRHQAAVLRRLAEAAPPPSIVLGDFNEWAPRGPVQRGLAGSMPARTRHRTFPARLPLLDLDRIYCRPAALVVRSWTDRRARHASDHLPVIAQLDLG